MTRVSLWTPYKRKGDQLLSPQRRYAGRTLWRDWWGTKGRWELMKEKVWESESNLSKVTHRVPQYLLSIISTKFKERGWCPQGLGWLWKPRTPPLQANSSNKLKGAMCVQLNSKFNKFMVNKNMRQGYLWLWEEVIICCLSLLPLSLLSFPFNYPWTLPRGESLQEKYFCKHLLLQKQQSFYWELMNHSILVCRAPCQESLCATSLF